MAKAKRKKAPKKYYVLRKGNKTCVFTGRSPRQAALKAAARGFAEIKLRERGRRNKDRTYTVHVFKGSVKKVDAPENRPEWLPAKIKKAVVSKVGIEKVKKI
jgi:hypothetical protein